ncbi:hypothetical protein Tco_1211377 [Tanacetum coccineum]
MTTPIPISNNNSQMHNDILAAGSRDRLPMLATGRYAQWQSRFMRYIDTRLSSKELRQCIYEGPYVMTGILVSEKLGTTTEEAPEAIYLILIGIGDDIYSTIDACTTAKEMWTVIERLK